MLVLHGFGSNKNGGISKVAADFFAQHGFVTLAFDMRGCGESEGERGKVIPLEQVRDTQHALDFLLQRPEVQVDRVGVMGFSFGAAVAIYACATEPRLACCISVGGWGDGALVNKVGPVVTLMLPQVAIVARLMRGSMIESLRSHHIRTARALGLSDYAVVVRHALRGALLPIISYAGPAAAALLTGSVIVETIFSIPGIGREFVLAALNRDYTMVMGTVVVIALFTIAFNLIVDILYALVDPRVRYD